MDPSDGKGFEKMETILHLKDPEDVKMRLGTRVKYDREEVKLEYGFIFTQEGGDWTTNHLGEIIEESENYLSEVTAS